MKGKLSIIQLTEVDRHQAVQEIMDRTPAFLESEQNMLDAIKVASGLVDEIIPVLDESSGKMMSVVREADLFSAYLDIQKDVQDIEK